MVKKKAPVILLTIVSVGVALAFAVNLQSHPKSQEEQMKAAQEQQPEPRPMEKRSDMQQAMDTAMDKAKTGQSKPGGPMLKTPSDPNRNGSLMMARHQEQYKPKPSATSTDSSWYVDRK
ncbi:MAG TPA: hypothetical protein VKT78_11995 [Fimbriimonadaceae bacterium]|nr:hypothetical protein [Fimbriimonadaceae bacterium]